jgi:hypothetical protein
MVLNSCNSVETNNAVCVCVCVEDKSHLQQWTEFEAVER